MKKLSLFMKNKKGASLTKVDTLIGVVVLLILVANLAPVALPGLFNTTAFSGVPSWAVTTLGILGVIAFIYIILKASR